MSLLKIVNSNHQLGKQKLVQVFSFWFEEDVHYFYNDFKLLWKKDKNIKSSEEICSKLKECCERHTLVLR